MFSLSTGGLFQHIEISSGQAFGHRLHDSLDLGHLPTSQGFRLLTEKAEFSDHFWQVRFGFRIFRFSFAMFQFHLTSYTHMTFWIFGPTPEKKHSMSIWPVPPNCLGGEPPASLLALAMTLSVSWACGWRAVGPKQIIMAHIIRSMLPCIFILWTFVQCSKQWGK